MVVNIKEVITFLSNGPQNLCLKTSTTKVPLEKLKDFHKETNIYHYLDFVYVVDESTRVEAHDFFRLLTSIQMARDPGDSPSIPDAAYALALPLLYYRLVDYLEKIAKPGEGQIHKVYVRLQILCESSIDEKQRHDEVISSLVKEIYSLIILLEQERIGTIDWDYLNWFVEFTLGNQGMEDMDIHCPWLSALQKHQEVNLRERLARGDFKKIEDK